MEISELFRNYKDGGNNYILKADSENRWTGFNKKTIDTLRSQYDTKFNLVLWGTKSETDFYCIPFSFVEHLFTEEHMTKGTLAEQGNARWTATVDNHIFKIHANSMYSAQIEKFYGAVAPISLNSYEDLDEVYGVDYTIEDAKANVKIRLGQSSFRKAVLENFEGKCCISGISEASMLVASHIVPWAVNKNYRSDPSNGLCLFVEFDTYFDKGFISVDQDFRIIVTDRLSDFSPALRQRLNALSGAKITKPKYYKIKEDYLRYHYSEILIKTENSLTSRPT